MKMKMLKNKNNGHLLRSISQDQGSHDSQESSDEIPSDSDQEVILIHLI